MGAELHDTQGWRDVQVELPLPMEQLHEESYAKLRCRWSSGTDRTARLEAAQHSVETFLQDNPIRTAEAFDLTDNWPTHPMMDSIRERVEDLLKTEIAERDMLCDEKDALFQVLFRLTSISPSRLFMDGGRAERLLDDVTTTSWDSIRQLDREAFDDIPLNSGLIRGIIDEQLTLIQHRLAQSPLPLERILGEQGICDGGWVLKQKDGEVTAHDRDTGDVRDVEFRQVDEELAAAFHRDLHYIHTPRTGTAYGLFLAGEEIPFSVESVEPVDRGYKKAGLLLRGYDPAKCIELTRLYNWPSTPMNTVSVMDKMLFSRIQRSGMDVQAVSTTIMPTYTLSKSQIAGGIDDVYIAKRPGHRFIRRQEGGRELFEHATRRKRDRRGKETVLHDHGTFPLLPVIEMMRPLQQPMLDPVETLDGEMICMGYQG